MVIEERKTDTATRQGTFLRFFYFTQHSIEDHVLDRPQQPAVSVQGIGRKALGSGIVTVVFAMQGMWTLRIL